MKPDTLDESWRGVLRLAPEDDRGCPWQQYIDLVEYVERFGRAALDARLAETGMALNDDAAPGEPAILWIDDRFREMFERGVLSAVFEHDPDALQEDEPPSPN